MKKIVIGALIMGVSYSALAFGEMGQWSSGWGQGVTEYVAVASKNTQLYIACDSEKPVTMTLTVNGKEYGSYSQKGFDLIIDGNEIQAPYDTRSRLGANNFTYAWDAIRKAKRLQAKTADGKIVVLPVKGASKVLPKTSSKKFDCKVDF